MKIQDVSTQHIFPSKRYTTYECILELVVTVPAACHTAVNIKSLVYLHIFTNISQRFRFISTILAQYKFVCMYAFLSNVCDIIVIFQDFA